jgi:hypothetical protein
MNFAVDMLARIDKDRAFLHRVLCSDVATFRLSGRQTVTASEYGDLNSHMS